MLKHNLQTTCVMPEHNRQASCVVARVSPLSPIHPPPVSVIAGRAKFGQQVALFRHTRFLRCVRLNADAIRPESHQVLGFVMLLERLGEIFGLTYVENLVPSRAFAVVPR